MALFGSSFDERPTGGEVVRVPLRGGRPIRRSVPFARELGRQEPLGLAVGPDGDLYVTLWKSGRVIAITAPKPGIPGRADLGTSRTVGAAISATAGDWIVF